MSVALSQAWNRYRAQLPTHIPETAVTSFGISFTVSLCAGALFASGSTAIVPLAFVSGTFSMVASLIDSGIRPLIHLWKLGHVDNANERFFDWMGRQLIVMSLTGWAVSNSLPLVGIRLSSWFIEKLMASSAALNLGRQYLYRQQLFGPGEARLYLNIVA